ncbi:GspE/PulE family protein [Ramlibacter monticola]|uniref:Type II/IV secretion system protein n=1 Tax=Ramlibacter monticola TaxID=1926872 RepID=A0A936Z146_9BURK|nr:GspE/PulE family protein [Ramlibacter monticola]MBL0393005.1 type II/IV secretion system protein [Ramlibacter monticola]
MTDVLPANAAAASASQPSGPRAPAIDLQAIREARQVASRSGLGIMTELERLAGLERTEFITRLGLALDYPVLQGEVFFASEALLDRVPLTEALQRGAVAVRTPSGEQCAVFADPFDRDHKAWLDERLRGLPVHLTHASDLAAYLGRLEEQTRAIDSVGRSMPGAAATEDAVENLSLSKISESSSVVVRLVNSTLYDAYRIHASDVHLETTPGGMDIRYRIDGVLDLAGAIQGAELAEQVISRIKVMAELDIAERRVPQDGRFKVGIGARQIDFRVSIMPSMFGEDAVLRILDKQELAEQLQGVRINNLGFDEPTVRTLQRLSDEPHGMLLVTGPTGSGKTTTLYAMITEVNTRREKIVTIEDPVEYQLPGVLQIPVNEKKGLTFSRGLRSILRHDPDKIMVGEIRDAETAQIAVQSALTGHLVYTTIHANNVFDVIGRFMQLGVDPYNLVSALNAIIAQRLLRLSCPHCATEITPDAELLAKSGLTGADLRDWHLIRCKGCEHCRGTGYRGRTAIAEMLILDDEIRQLIIERQPVSRLKEVACAKGTRFLRDSALDLARQGRTTLQEVNRVTFVA